MSSIRDLHSVDPLPTDSKKEESRLLFTSLFMPIVFVILIWLVAIFEYVTEIDLAVYGIMPKTFYGLRGILFSPFIHGDWGHVASNSLPFLILGFLMLYSYRKVAFKSFVFIYLASGFMVWVTGRPAYHIGASNLVYGFAFFLFFSGVFRKDIQSIAMSLLVTFVYGGIVWGLFPFDWEVSWEGHLMGGLAGAVTAYAYRKVDLPEPIELDDDDEDDDHPEPEPPMVVYRYTETNKDETGSDPDR